MLQDAKIDFWTAEAERAKKRNASLNRELVRNAVNKAKCDAKVRELLSELRQMPDYASSSYAYLVKPKMGWKAGRPRIEADEMPYPAIRPTFQQAIREAQNRVDEGKRRITHLAVDPDLPIGGL